MSQTASAWASFRATDNYGSVELGWNGPSQTSKMNSHRVQKFEKIHVEDLRNGVQVAAVVVVASVVALVVAALAAILVIPIVAAIFIGSAIFALTAGGTIGTIAAVVFCVVLLKNLNRS